MEVFELNYPGTWLDMPDGHKVQDLLIQLESQLADVSIGIEFFEKASARRVHVGRATDHKEHHARSQKVAIIARAMEAELPHDLSGHDRFTKMHQIHEAADLQVRREEWAAGHLPQAYEHRLPFVYAHVILYALDAIGKTINVLVDMGISPSITTARDTYESAIPHLKSVRDSAHHIEDRARGVHHGKKPLVLQPINTGAIVAPNGALALSNLDNNKLGYTAEDGHYREIEITKSTVKAAQSAVQQVLNALTWHGPTRTSPR